VQVSSPSTSLAAVDDRALAERSRTDRSAFAELYRRHVDSVHAFAYRRSGSRDVAEEATSATFEKALRSINSFEWRPTGIRPWLYRIASNEVANVYRRTVAANGPRGQLALRELTPDAGHAQPIGSDSALPDGEPLHRALNELPARYREVITLRYLSGLSADEAATALGCSKPMLAVTLNRALTALRKKLSMEPTIGGGGGR
jgi:RNA polymerase sigma-70 factor (ECF subfamily)